MIDERKRPASALPSWAVPGGVVFAVYLFTFALLPARGFWINDNGAKFIQVEGIIKNHYRDYSIPWPGLAIDTHFRFNPVPPPIGEIRHDRLYVTYSQPFALVSTVFFRTMGFRGLRVLPLVTSLLMLWGVWRLAGLIPGSREAPQLALLVAAFGTPLWFYSSTFWEHAPAACLGVWSVLFLMRHLAGGRDRLLAWSGILAGLSIYLRADMYVLTAALIAVLPIYGRRSRAHAGLFIAGFVISLVPLFVFQWWALGTPLGLHLGAHSPFAHGEGAYLRDRWTVFRLILLNTHRNPWLSAIAAAPFLVFLALYPRVGGPSLIRAVPLAAGLASLAGLLILTGHFRAESPMWWLVDANGLFASSPILILAFLRSRDNETAPAPNLPDMMRMLALIYALLYVILSPTTSTGVHWGCRFLLPIFPILSVLAAWTWVRFRHARLSGKGWGYAAAGIAAALTLFAQLYSVRLLHEREAASARLNQVIAERPEDVVVAGAWFLPQELAPNFYRKQIFFVRQPEEWRALAETLRAAGIDRALTVSWPRAERPASANTITLDDGLNFVSVDLEPVSLR